MADIDAVFKAYDIRGTVPDQLDADLCRRIGAAFARSQAAPVGSSWAATCAESGRGAGRRLRRRRPVPGRRRRRPRAGLDRPRLLRRRAASTRRARCSPPRTTRPPYNGIKLCLAGARPVGEDTGLGEIKARARQELATGADRAGPDDHDEPARRLRRPRPLLRRPDGAAAAQGGGRHGQRHGRPGRAGGVRWAAVRARDPVRRARRHASRTTRPIRSSPRTSATCRPACSRSAPTSAWRSTATPTASSSSTSGASSLSGSLTTAIVAKGDARPASRRDDPPQPHLLEGRARGHPRERRRAGAHQGRALLHQGS